MLITNKGLLSFIRFCRLFGILILFTGWLGSTAAETDTRVSLDLEGVDIVYVITKISEQLGGRYDIVCSNEVKGYVTVKVNNISWRDALSAVLQNTGYGYKQYGHVLFVDTQEKITEDEEGGAKHIVLYNVWPNDVNEMCRQIEPLLSSKGHVFPDERTGQVVVIDHAAKQKQVKFLIAKLKKPERQILIQVRIISTTNVINEAIEQRWNLPLLRLPVIGIVYQQEPAIQGYAHVTAGVIPYFDSLLDMQILSEHTRGYESVTGRLLILENSEGTLATGQKFSVLIRDQAGNAVSQFYSAGFKVSARINALEGITDGLPLMLKIKLKIEMSSFDRASVLAGRPIIPSYESELETYVRDGETAVICRRIEGLLGQHEKEPGCLLIARFPFINRLFRPWTRVGDLTHQYILITPRIVN
jgi:type IV pilus assembly protein PilQ